MNLDPKLLEMLERLLNRLNSKRLLTVLMFLAFGVLFPWMVLGSKAQDPATLIYVVMMLVFLLCLFCIYTFQGDDNTMAALPPAQRAIDAGAQAALEPLRPASQAAAEPANPAGQP